MNLAAFLELCDPDMKVAITNENGFGGAAYLAWPESGWTVKSVLEELGGGGFHVCGIELHDDTLYIIADENPWDYGSYWEGEWSHNEQHGYEVKLTATAYAVESCEERAIDTVKMMIEGGDVDFEFEVKRDDNVMCEW